ncbi:MAG: hypothetical protein HY720_09570 [Planctomycetes bacterium]|nr:hypothetical protein [Planctomycetota bacterium]
MIELRFDSQARDEIDQQAAWYSGRGEGLRERLLGETEELLRLIGTRPASFPVVRRVRGGSVVRRARLRKFPFSVVFAVQGNVAVVVALAHDGRRPFYWKGRLRPHRP